MPPIWFMIVGCDPGDPPILPEWCSIVNVSDYFSIFHPTICPSISTAFVVKARPLRALWWLWPHSGCKGALSRIALPQFLGLWWMMPWYGAKIIHICSALSQRSDRSVAFPCLRLLEVAIDPHLLTPSYLTPLTADHDGPAGASFWLRQFWTAKRCQRAPWIALSAAAIDSMWPTAIILSELRIWSSCRL